MSRSSPTMEEVDYMRLALTLAQKGFYSTTPNPCVGAVLVRDGQILGQGWHQRAGQPHAEVLAIRDAEAQGHSTTGATLYVTLEPCCTHGRTPPCTEAIRAAGLRRVVVGTTDPNPAHAGRAYAILRREGIEVSVGLLEEECRHLNRSFNHWITTRRPWVILKLALSADGSLDRPDGHPWLTGAESRRDVHLWRSGCDAILVGAETVRQDNPLLTVRGVRTHRQPLRVIVTRSGRLPARARIFHDPLGGEVLVFRGRSWRYVLESLGKRQVTRLMVEGGARTADSLIRGQWINEVILYYAPTDFSGDPQRIRPTLLRRLICSHTTMRRFGPDVRFTGVVTGYIT